MFTQEPKQNSNASATATVLGFRNCQAKSKIKNLSKRFQNFIVQGIHSYFGFTQKQKWNLIVVHISDN